MRSACFDFLRVIIIWKMRWHYHPLNFKCRHNDVNNYTNKHVLCGLGFKTKKLHFPNHTASCFTFNSWTNLTPVSVVTFIRRFWITEVIHVTPDIIILILCVYNLTDENSCINILKQKCNNLVMKRNWNSGSTENVITLSREKKALKQWSKSILAVLS